MIDDNKYELHEGDAVVVPHGARHNIINTSVIDDLKLYTIYSPPHHRDGIVRQTKADAQLHEEEFDGQTTERMPAEVCALV